MTITGRHPATRRFNALRHFSPPEWMEIPLALVALAILIFAVVYLRG